MHKKMNLYGMENKGKMNLYLFVAMTRDVTSGPSGVRGFRSDARYLECLVPGSWSLEASGRRFLVIHLQGGVRSE